MGPSMDGEVIQKERNNGEDGRDGHWFFWGSLVVNVNKMKPRRLPSVVDFSLSSSPQ